MRLAELNTMEAPDAARVLRGCADVDRWVAALLVRRPYADRRTLLDTAHLLATWSDAELAHALADHPRIGERGTGPTTATSAREQAGVTDADREAFREANRRYEERFDRIYLVRAAGRTAAEMLALLEQRLTHDDATELAVTKQQLTEIAMLRLEDLVEEDPVEEEVEEDR